MAKKKKVVAKSKKIAKAKKKATPRREIQQNLIANMRSWQRVENASVASTGRVMEKTENPIIRLIMEIIQRDSQMHYRVQEWIAESLGGKTVTLTPDEIGDVWEMIEDHINLEKRTLELARTSLESIQGSRGMIIQTYLLEYLSEDEKKHDMMLERLLKIQRGMYPYG